MTKCEQQLDGRVIVRLHDCCARRLLRHLRGSRITERVRERERGSHCAVGRVSCFASWAQSTKRVIRLFVAGGGCAGGCGGNFVALAHSRRATSCAPNQAEVGGAVAAHLARGYDGRAEFIVIPASNLALAKWREEKDAATN